MFLSIFLISTTTFIMSMMFNINISRTEYKKEPVQLRAFLDARATSVSTTHRPILQKSEWQERIEKVQDYCSNHKFIINKPSDQIRTDYEDWLTYNIVHISGLALNWCMVPKVASGSMSVMILPYLKKLKVNRKFPYSHLEVWTRAGRLSYSNFVQQMREGIPSFLITRHPFARIVSAYRHKIENRTKFQDGNAFYADWSRKIIKSVDQMFGVYTLSEIYKAYCLFYARPSMQ